MQRVTVPTFSPIALGVCMAAMPFLGARPLMKYGVNPRLNALAGSGVKLHRDRPNEALRKRPPLSETMRSSSRE